MAPPNELYFGIMALGWVGGTYGSGGGHDGNIIHIYFSKARK